MRDRDILKVKHLSKVFKTGTQSLPVLKDISFTIEEGSACAIVGPSGSGKTTLIAVCAGLEQPSEGSVVFNGVEMQRASEEGLARLRNQFVGFIFQSFHLLPSLSALENIMVPAEIRGENHARGRATELLEQVGLSDRRGHYPISVREESSSGSRSRGRL